MDHLKKIDMFGAALTFNLNQNTKYHQTRLGGFSTFVVYSLVLTYAVMNLRTWAIGDLLPTVTTRRSAILNQHVPLLSELQVNLTLQSYNSQRGQTLNNQWFTILNGYNRTVVPYDSDTASYTFKMNFNINQTQPDINSQIEFLILSCDPAKVTEGKCANNTAVTSHLQKNAYYFAMEFNLTYINPNNFEVTVVKQIAYISLEQGAAHFSTINLGATLFQMYKPAIVQSDEYYYGFTTQKQYIETFNQSYGKQAYGDNDMYGSFYIYSFFSLDFVADHVLIQYPSIFTILGNIGAIGGILLYFKHVIIFHNSREAEKQMIDTVIKTLYPKYQEVKVETRGFNLQKSVTFQDRSIKSDSFDKFEEMMKAKIYEYFSLPQLIVNQIQFHTFMKEVNPQFQYIGIEFDSLIRSESQQQLGMQFEMESKPFAIVSVRSSIDHEPQCQSVK